MEVSEMEMQISIGTSDPIPIHINDRKNWFYKFRAIAKDTDIWEDGDSKAEALGKLIIRLKRMMNQ